MWLISIGALLCLSLFFARLRFQLQLVVGRSMSPALGPGDLLIVDKRAYRKGEPARGDIVCFHYSNGERLVKRVVGLPGEELELRDGILYVNGNPLAQPWLAWHERQSRARYISKGTLSERRFAVLGDNPVSPLLIPSPIISSEQITGKVIRSFHLGPKPGTGAAKGG